MIEVLLLLSVLAVSLEIVLAVVFAALAFAVAATGLFVAFRRTTVRQTLERRKRWESQVRLLCVEARTLVDLLTPGREATELPSTSAIAEVASRLRRLDGRLRPLAPQAPTRVGEGIEDLQRVALSLGAALEAERAMRVRTESTSRSRQLASAHQIAERAAELDAAAQELLWLVEIS